MTGRMDGCMFIHPPTHPSIHPSIHPYKESPCFSSASESQPDSVTIARPGEMNEPGKERCCPSGGYHKNGQGVTFGEWMSSWCCCAVFRKQRQRYSNGVMEDDSTEPPFHTDADHREFVSAGAAAGLAVSSPDNLLRL